MSLSVLPINSPSVAEIAQKLPAGRIYTNGRGFVPNVRRDLHGKLTETIEATSSTSKSDQSSTTENSPARQSNSLPTVVPIRRGYPRSWDDISVGHLVIAYDRDYRGWWEAIVIAQDGDMLTLRWRDYPEQAKVMQHRTAVALLSANGTSRN
jgi:hypothetical protein